MYVISIFLITVVLPPDLSVLTSVSDSLPTIATGDTSYKCISPSTSSEMNMEMEERKEQVNPPSKSSDTLNEDVPPQPAKPVLESRDEAILYLAHSMLETDESLLDPSTQIHRDYLNMKRFLEYALSNFSPATFQPVFKYSEFASSGVYLAPLPPRKSSLEQFMQSVTPKQEWNRLDSELGTFGNRPATSRTTGARDTHSNVPVHSVNDITEEGDLSDPLSIIDISDTERDITIGVSSHFCLPPSSYYQAVNLPPTPAIIESQLRGFLGALHCEFDMTVIQRGFLLNFMMGG